MQISKEQTGNLNAVIKFSVVPEDYRPKVDEMIKKYQRTANIPGFRPGKVPVGMIKKMYGKSVLVEELNELLYKALYKYIDENKISIIGSPLPLKNENEQVLEDGKSFEFSYEIGLAPEFNFEVSINDKLPYYLVKVEDAMIDREVLAMQRRFGKFTTPEISEESHILYGQFEELDEQGIVKEGGHKHTSTIAIEMIKDPIDRNIFVGHKKEETVTFNPMKVMGDEAEVSALLNVKKDQPAIASDYRFTIKTVNYLEKAELNEEFFNKTYGEGVVKSEEELREKVRQEIASHYEVDSDRKLQKDLKKYLLEKCDIQLPDDFLKRMLKNNMEGDQPKDYDFDHDYFHLAEDLKWSLIRNRVVTENNIVVEDEEIKNLAGARIRQQFSQYGQFEIPEDRMAGFIEEHLKKDDSYNLYEKSILENKVFRALKDKIKLDAEELPMEEFAKKLQEKTEHELEHHH